MTGWEFISVNTTMYGVVLGYKIQVYEKDKRMKTILVNDCCDVVLSNLSPKTKYSIIVCGFTKYGDGSALHSIITTLGMYSISFNHTFKRGRRQPGAAIAF